MKPWRLLSLPGYALSETARYVWLVLGIFILAVAILITASTHADTLRWVREAAIGWGVLNALLWLLLANSVLLARDARAQRMPALQRDTLISLVGYGGLGIVLPALLLGWVGGHVLTVMIILLFGAAMGAIYALMPSLLALLVVVAPQIPAALSPWLPQAMQPGFNEWAGPMVAVLWLMLAWRIRGLVRGDHSLQGPNAPMMLLFRQKFGGLGGAASDPRWGLRTPGQGPAWTQPKVDLRGSGTGHAERSLRIAMGDWSMPLAWPSRLWQCVRLLAAVVIVGLILLLQAAANHHDHMQHVATELPGAGSLLFFGTIVSAIFAINTVRSLYRRWGNASAELPLLALLPGLGDTPAVKRALLRACVLPGLGVQLVLALLLLIFSTVMHMGAEGEVLVLLGILGSAGLMCAFALVVLGAEPARGWGMALLMGAGYVWICVSSSNVQFNAQPAVAMDDVALGMLTIGWLAFFAALLWLARRGWRAFQQRPHAFLVNRE